MTVQMFSSRADAMAASPAGTVMCLFVGELVYERDTAVSSSLAALITADSARWSPKGNANVAHW